MYYELHENLKKMIIAKRYPNKEAMELKITNFVADGLITVTRLRVKRIISTKDNLIVERLGINFPSLIFLKGGVFNGFI